jgi:hypothetical protein
MLRTEVMLASDEAELALGDPLGYVILYWGATEIDRMPVMHVEEDETPEQVAERVTAERLRLIFASSLTL